MDSASETRRIYPELIQDFVELWFAALRHRRAEILVGMCDPDVVVRPFRARQEDDQPSYEGHEGIRAWVASLDRETQITLELKNVEIAGVESALVEADVWLDRPGERSGGPVVSMWHFTGGKLDRAIGYASREDAIAAVHS